MDKTNDIRYATHKLRGIAHKIDELIYKATAPDSDMGTHISDAEKESIEIEIKELLKQGMNVLAEAKTLPKHSPCSFCEYSKPLKEHQED